MSAIQCQGPFTQQETNEPCLRSQMRELQERARLCLTVSSSLKATMQTQNELCIAIHNIEDSILPT